MITLERFVTGSDLVHRREPGPRTSPAEETPIAHRIRSADPSLFWSTLLLPAPRHNAIQALYFFCRELRGIADGDASRTVKLAMMTDWRTQIGLLYAGRPQHSVTRALTDAVERFDLRCVDFLAIIDGMETEVRTDIRAPSLEQLYFYCKQRSVAIVRIALRILGAAQADADQVAAPLGRGMVLTGILRDLAPDAARQRLYLPRELLVAEGIFATIPSYVLAQPALPQVCNALAERAAAYFADAQRSSPARSSWARLATTAVVSSYRTLLKALLARGWTRLNEPVRLPVWRQTALLIGCSLIGR
jgi:phytoene synthase